MHPTGTLIASPTPPPRSAARMRTTWTMRRRTPSCPQSRSPPRLASLLLFLPQRQRLLRQLCMAQWQPSVPRTNSTRHRRSTFIPPSPSQTCTRLSSALRLCCATASQRVKRRWQPRVSPPPPSHAVRWGSSPKRSTCCA
ncbi:hypothetical protein T492DRAFT_921068 [Pavlovales sp. CCMP2436]|nr:hypothetical protein T492DRAFT_921068 [Pavlovales sp. CCMP2436]